MQNLLEFSRRTNNQNESPVKLSHLSPEKYGKGAYCDLTYTPSKLADNFLYREVTTLKKIQEGNGKLRQTEAMNSLFQDRLEQIKEERDGIQKSLTSQIIMYKKLLQQCEIKSEVRVKDIQSSFKIEIKKLITEKEEQAKYAQSQKELLENRIEQLQAMLHDLKDKHDFLSQQHDNLRNQKEKQEIMYHHSVQNLAQLESKRSIEADDAKNKHQELSRQIFTNQVQHKKGLEDAISSKNKQIENLERLHRTELEKLDNKRSAQNLMKNQQIKDITYAFEAEAKRLNEIVNMKQRMVDSINKDLNKEKQRVLELTRNYENQIHNLAHEKSRLIQEIDDLSQNNMNLGVRLNESLNSFEKEKMSLENYILSLKQQLQHNQVNFVRQKDRNNYIAGDLENQIVSLKSQNINLLNISSENEVLVREVRNLRQLLLESSHEMESCKEQFIRMGKERDLLILKLREVGCENDVLHRIKMQREVESNGWKDSYLIARNRY